MTLASEIIARAYRETNIVPISGSPSTAEQTEALALLQPIILGVLGNAAGVELADLNVGGDYDQSSYCTPYAPENARLVLNLSAATTINLPPQPYDGQRIAIVDAAANLATYNLTLDGNGRKIEGAATLALSTNGMDRQWLYRADTANWVKLSALATSDEMPFPAEFDTYFVTALALRINPRHGVALAAETQVALKDAEKRLAARYRKPRPRQDMPRGFVSSRDAYGLGVSDFNAGRTWGR